MLMFGFQKSVQSGWKDKVFESMVQINLIYTILLGGLFLFFSLFSFFYPLLNGTIETKDVFQKIPIGSLFLEGIDKSFSRFVDAGYHLLGSIKNEKPLFPENKKYLDILFDYITNDGSWISKPMIKKLGKSWDILQGGISYKEDIYSLLGEKKEQTYLVILQNTAESRPNGGFFGSFAVIKIKKGRIVHFEIMDSYLPAFNRPGTSLLGPPWLLNFLPERVIYFVGANKIGFTYHDGANIKTLYEKSFPGQWVRGVIFVSTDLLQEILPSFRKQQRIRQFTNAATDLIRGGDKRGKKELYIGQVKDYFKEHMVEFLKGFIKKLPILLNERYINMYLTDISGPFHGFLRREKLTTRFEKDTMYFWDSNISYSKIDNFSQKIIQFYDESGSLVKESMDNIILVHGLPSGKYHIKIIYTLHIPEYYKSTILNLEKEYGIQLTSREKHILALDPEWATRGVVYMPPDMKVTMSTGDYYHFSEFETPFAHAVYYKVKSTENNMVKVISLDVIKR